MRTLLSIESTAVRSGFQAWREAIHERIVPVELTRLGDAPFAGTLEAADIGSLPISRVTQSAVRTEATAHTIGQHDKHDTLTLVIALAGQVTSVQHDRDAVQRPGDIVLLDRRPTVMVSHGESRTLLVEVPRARLEAMLGPARLYAALPVAAATASTALVTGFFDGLVRLHGRMPLETATRMASIGVDLLIASFAERLAREAPKSVHGTLVVQRAKARVEADLGDPNLDPARLAAAVGVSLRRLQELFHAQGHHIADWIWERRLDAAARRLRDPRQRHLSIGLLAHGCGFASQAHFARRFKERYGMTATEYREGPS